jgi:glyoxylase-like metal-dependent hydrolase (beta-lactamase superfamily II)/8-oxo-dGTP pyrophosphatase MutT (NUDIX family)
LVLVRDGADGAEVLLVQRADRGDQNSNAWVFPGGLIDASDQQVHAYCHDFDDAQASARLGLVAGGLDYLIAALRETLEEAGLLLAFDASGRTLDDSTLRMLADWRIRSRALPNGQAGSAFAALCRIQGWRLAVRELTPIAHWITPLGRPKRFDTHFLLAAAPPGQAVSVDGVEIVDHRWVQPGALLQREPEIHVTGPARAIVQDLAHHHSTREIFAWAEALGPIVPTQPRLARDSQGRIAPVHPTHPAYAEVGRIDPQGEGLACAAIRPGVPVELAPGLLRITASNGSTMTGPGTNTYLLRGGHNWVLIDPGPDDEMHVRAVLDLLSSLPGQLASILVTHTHIDHSPAARHVKAATGALISGRKADHPQWQDPDFAPDRIVRGGERLDFDPELTLRVVHTPGHASNHLCFLHEQQRVLFTGDHVMQGSTVVINPPDGDMAAYLESLHELSQSEAFDAIAPGHGFLIERPRQLLEALIAHRLRREAKVIDALGTIATTQAATVDALLARVYDDVPAERHSIARCSLLAHLLHLESQGRARGLGECWLVC